jgi:glycosyltransferase involved in cell wall biosynthesis
MIVASQTDISVIICTRNRAASLERTLISATALNIPDGMIWELLIVDNGSSDTTPAVVASFADRLPVRYVVEFVAGLSNARNRGVAEARGALICWTDDDVELDAAWLAAYHAAAEQFPEAAFFGGNITPVLEGPTSAWFTSLMAEPEIQSLTARRSFASAVRLSADGGLPYGANFAVRTAEQRRHRYDPSLGVSPSHSRSGEETAVILAIIAEGGTGFSVPSSNVRHMIPTSRQTRKYIWSFHRAIGETWALLSMQQTYPNFMGPSIESRWHFFGIPIWVGRVAIRSWCASLVNVALGHDSLWLQNTSCAARHWGAAVFLFQNRRKSQ